MLYFLLQLLSWVYLVGELLFIFFEIISVIVGILVRLFAKDPRFYESNSITRNQIQKPFWSDVKDLIHEAKSVIRIPSFQVIVAQGVFGSFSGSAWSFAPMWLELVGFSHEETAFLWTILVIGVSLGGLFDGGMGDIVAKRLPNTGRNNLVTDKLRFGHSFNSTFPACIAL